MTKVYGTFVRMSTVRHTKWAPSEGGAHLRLGVGLGS